jgi:hypothetical protein
MVPRRSNIGWWLLAAASLVWLGCNQVEPRVPAYRPPQPAPLLQIAESPKSSLRQAQTPATTGVQPPPPTSPEALAKLGDPQALPDGGHTALLPALPQQAPPSSPSKTADANLQTVRALQRLAVERLSATPAYVARLRRRELAGIVQRPEELILLMFRQEPASLRLRWVGTEAKDRELVWTKSQPSGRIYLLPAASDPGNLGPGGRRTVVLADGPQGLGQDRYAVGETGIAPLVDRFGRLVDALERGDPRVGTVKYLGKVKRAESDAALDAVLHVIPPGYDNGLPKGGQRMWYFDSNLRFPVLVVGNDPTGKEVEYYFFDAFLFPAQIRDDEFTPASLGQH